MRHLLGLTALLAGVMVALGAVGGAGAQSEVQHGIGLTKGCTSPTKVGDPYICTFTVRNVLDEAQDTLTITQLVDVVHAAAPVGDQTSSAVLDVAPVAVSGGATCTSPPARVCTLPFGSTVNIGPFAFYTVHGTDFTGANPLTDDASLTWHDLCDDPAHTGDTNCVPNPPTVGAASQSVVVQRPSVTVTAIHDAAHNPVMAVAAGSVVHDLVVVTTPDPSPSQFTPSGNVTVSFFANNNCLGAPVATSFPIPLDVNGTADATSFPQGPVAPGFYGFQASYPGDSTYGPSTGPCEPLQVVDANIQLTPARATNPVGTTHVLTCHVNVNDGTGWVDAPDGTVCTVTIVSGPGTPAAQNCTASGGLGDCQATITSAVTGTTVIEASTDVTVAGVALHRQTGDANPGDGPNASKDWLEAADANIQITPSVAANEVGTNHVLTVTVAAVGGTVDAGPHTATASIVSGPGSFVGSPTCTYTGGGVFASCTVTITSAVVGTTVVSATSNIPVGGVVIPRTTGTAQNTASGGSGNASKNWVDASIQLTPATAANEVGTSHVLTCHVNVNDGTGVVDAPDGTTCTVTIVSGPGSPVAQNCTTAGGTGSCSVVISSSTAGTTTLDASTIVTVDGLSVARTTNGAGGNSGPATKHWVDANIQLTPARATNPVGTTHVFTITVNAIGGTIDAGPQTATASIVSGPGSFVGSPTCTYTGGAATASCQVVITSAVVGTTVVQATSNIPVDGVAISRTTGTAQNTASGGSGNASKDWVDANIQITPSTATNTVGTNHVLTVTVAAVGSTVDAGPHTATASIVSGPGSFVGSPTCTYTGGGVFASCTVTITSAVVGTTVVSATSNIPVGGVVIPRTTGTAQNTASGGSGNAAKIWTDQDLALTGMPSNMTVTATSGAGAVARWAGPTATDEEPGATVGCNPASGSMFPLGLTTVTCTATDADDSNSPVSATFTVAVVYRIAGFFSPVPNSKWNSGQTVPIKIGLTYANGTAIVDPDAVNLANACAVTFSAAGVQSTPQPQCMKYDTAMHQFIYNWKLGKSPPGPDTLTVTVTYPGPVSNSKTENVVIS